MHTQEVNKIKSDMISKRRSHQIYQKDVCLKAYIAYGSNFHLWYMNELQPRKSQKTPQLTIRELKLVGMFWERQQVS